jgi:cytochrome P450
VATLAAGLEVPTLPGRPLVGTFPGIRRDYLGTISRADREIGGLTRIVAGPPGWRLTVISVTSPELIEEVLSRPADFRKQHPGYRELRRALGDNVLTSEDEVWHRQRRFLASMFTRRRVASSYAPVMTDEAQRLVTRWRSAAEQGAELDAYPEMIAMASRVSGRILFGADMSAAADLLTRFRRVNDQLLRRAVSPHPLPTYLPTPGNRRMNRGLRQTREIVDELIARRRGEGALRQAQGRSGPARGELSEVQGTSAPAQRTVEEAPMPDFALQQAPGAQLPEAAGAASGADDMLGLLLAARDAADESDRLSDTEVADQAMLFLLAGHDTTSVTLSCVLLQLALHPEWQDTLHREVDDVLAGRPPTAPELPRMPWLLRAVRETLRLFPAAHGVGRSTERDQLLAGYRIPAGVWVEVSIWGVHHSPRTWSEPERFDPARFDLAHGEPAGGHRYAYLPFGAGARACIGMPISLTEVQITLATILQAYEVSTPLRHVPVHAAITLLPTGRVPIVVRPR